ncbi:MAG: YceI family protein [Pseudomonadota bacterium]
MIKQALQTAAIATFLAAGPAFAGGWNLSPDESKITFGSIKKNAVGEAHHFSGLSGTVGEDGAATVDIDVASVETWIDIRNERMLEHVFASENFPKVTIATNIDMAEVSGLAAGETTTMTTTANLSFLGKEVPVEADLFIAVLGKNKVLVTTDEMIMLSTADLGVEPGIDELKKLADLPSISRVSPVSLRLVFEKN